MDSKVYQLIVENCGKVVDRKSWNDLANELNFGSGDALRSAFRREKRNKDFGTEEIKSTSEARSEIPLEDPIKYRESEEIKSDGTIISDRLIEICEAESKNPTSLLIAHKFDPEKFELVSAKNNMWHMIQKNVGKTILYQSKITVRPKSTKEITFEDVDKFFQTFESNNGSSNFAPRNYKKNAKILEIDLADIHVGNSSVFNSEFSIEKRCADVINEIVRRAENLKLEKIILVNLGDIFHYDTFKITTTSGTNVTSNLDYPTMFDTGARILINAIDKLSELAPVEVIGIYGNHDFVSSYTLMKAIEFYYRRSDFVSVDAGHLQRKFRKYGNCLILWAHGDMGKGNAYSLIQREARKEFGETKFAEIHSGHFHSQTTTEKDGVIIRYLPTLTETDAWHYGEGYTGALRSTVAFVWDKVSGLEEMWFINA
jgi:hypothetical protein